jgi:hypothetical protein
MGLCRKMTRGFGYFKTTIMMLTSKLVTLKSYRFYYFVENVYSTVLKLSYFVTVIATNMNETRKYK